MIFVFLFLTSFTLSDQSLGFLLSQIGVTLSGPPLGSEDCSDWPGPRPPYWNQMDEKRGEWVLGTRAEPKPVFLVPGVSDCFETRRVTLGAFYSRLCIYLHWLLSSSEPIFFLQIYFELCCPHGA